MLYNIYILCTAVESAAVAATGYCSASQARATRRSTDSAKVQLQPAACTKKVYSLYAIAKPKTLRYSCNTQSLLMEATA